MDASQLPAGLLPTSVEQLTVLPSDAVVVLSSRAAGSGSAVLGRLAGHASDQLVETVQYIDLSKVPGLAAGLAAPAAAEDRDAAAGRISLHHEYPRWQAIKERLDIAEDYQLARVLLDLYEANAASGQLVKPDEEEEEEDEEEEAEDVFADSDSVTVLHCEISDATGSGGGGGRDATARAAARVPRVAGSEPAPSAAADGRRRCSRLAVAGRRERPCPRSRKPPGWRPEPQSEPGDPADGDDSGSEAGPADDAAEPASKLFTFPPVEPELLCYFSCGLCDERGFSDVESYFDHLWRAHTELHMVGGRIQRVPIRLRPQLFVICALCGLNNKGSNGECNVYLTQQHMPIHGEVVAAAEATLRCDACPAEFADRGSLALHALDAEHGNPAQRCSACGEEMEGTLNYIDHLRRHFLSQPYQCYFCMQMFASEAVCISHIKRHHAADYNVHKCSGCGYVTALFHDFLLHVRSHSQLNRHVCHVCGVIFVSKMSLKHHIPTHTDSQFPCEKCGKVFTHPQTRRRHVLNAHNRPDKCTCSVCGRQFGSAYSMRRHFMIHTGERPFQCDKCGRGFVQKGDLQSHYKRCKFTEISNSLFLAM